MIYLLAYYLIGVAVSAYHIWYYRLSPKAPTKAKQGDALGALIGPWVWPAQLVVHQFTKRRGGPNAKADT